MTDRISHLLAAQLLPAGVLAFLFFTAPAAAFRQAFELLEQVSNPSQNPGDTFENRTDLNNSCSYVFFSCGCNPNKTVGLTDRYLWKRTATYGNRGEPG